MTEAQLKKAMKVLVSSKKTHLKQPMQNDVHIDTSTNCGVYALWEGRALLYVGHAGKSGIRRRLQDHWLGGGTLGLFLLVVKIAPTVGPDHWARLSRGEEGVHHKAQQYIRTHLKYTFVECKTKSDAMQLEKRVHKTKFPLLNNLRKQTKDATNSQ
jgi:predicted GIY-YIG superfamily endonuclease